MVCKQSANFYRVSISILTSLILLSCSGNKAASSDNKNKENEADTIKNNNESFSNSLEKLDNKRQLVKLSHHINTSANEYFPVLSADEKIMYFSATHLPNGNALVQPGETALRMCVELR